MTDAELMDLIGDATFMFWLCPEGCSSTANGGLVTWVGSVATCSKCGETSEEKDKD